MHGEGAFFWNRLESFRGRTALIDAAGGETLDYATLAERADRFAQSVRQQSGLVRPLLLIETANEPEPIIAYLGALRASWPVILLADGATALDARIRDTYNPNVLFRRDTTGQWRSEHVHGDCLAMHPDLAVMLSTSGTTGAPKLVRLSARNLEANARSIASYLAISPQDRAITTLPFHYSYGMSVLHTHLLCGAALVLTDRSVIEEAFWTAFTRHAATSMALVPFQFDLLEKTGFADRELPSLRTVTQAGGKLAEPMIRRYAALGRMSGWKLFVMYGQTEASPRMAYVPPDVLEVNADSIGRAVPGGRFELIDADGKPIAEPGRPGELVYYGANVMMGYALSRADLAAPPGPERLATGDMAEWKPNGLLRVVGRINRFAKLFGLRISLDDVEETLRGAGIAAYCVGRDDERLTLFVTGNADPRDVEARVVSKYGLAGSAVTVEPIAEVPLLSSGKIDYRALSARAAALAKQPRAPLADDIEAAVRRALKGRAFDPAKSFAQTGADSLAYIEVQLALSERLGHAPEGWETMPLAQVMALQPAPAVAGGLQPVPVDLICRVLALCGVIALHATSITLAGGAHLLLLLAGHSLARFQRAQLLAGRIGAMLLTMLLPLLAGYYAIVGATHLLAKPVDWQWFLLAGNFDPDIHPPGITPYWFVSLYAQAMVLIALPFLLEPVRRFVAENPLHAAALVMAVLALISEATGLAEVLGETRLRHPVFALQLIALGWCIALADTPVRKLATTAMLVAETVLVWRTSVSVFTMLTLGGLAMVWLRSLPLPEWLGWIALQFGRHSMAIYLLHVVAISVLAKLPLGHEPLRFVVVLAATVTAAVAAGWVADSVRNWHHTRQQPQPRPVR